MKDREMVYFLASAAILIGGYFLLRRAMKEDEKMIKEDSKLMAQKKELEQKLDEARELGLPTAHIEKELYEIKRKLEETKELSNQLESNFRQKIIYN